MECKMNMKTIFLLLFLFKNGTLGETLKKCCDSDSYLVNSTRCEIDKEKRIQILADEVDLISKILNNPNVDYCVEVTNGTIGKFKIKDNFIIEESIIEIDYYPKCCPLNHYYNSEIHSCVLNQKLDYSFISWKYIRVGLPFCLLIIDYKLNSDNPIELKNLELDEFIFPDESFCIDKNEKNDLIARGCFDNFEICNTTRCIHKCCPDGQSFVGYQNCMDTYHHGLNLSFSKNIHNTKGAFAIIHEYSDCEKYDLVDNEGIHSLDKYGVFRPYYNLTSSYLTFDVANESYCIEHEDLADNEANFKFFLCYEKNPIELKFMITLWAKPISCICIVLVIVLIYFNNPKKINIINKNIIGYCIAMLSQFSLLTYAQFQTDREYVSCLITSILSFYTALCIFMWLNVMSFDIWKYCGSKEMMHSRHNRNESRRFLMYSLYAWGVPLVPVVLVFVLYSTKSGPIAIRPYLTEYKCFLSERPGNYAKLLYYSLPTLIIEVSNVVFFIMTLRYYLTSKCDINKGNDSMRNNYEQRKEQFFIIMKLVIYMGISFIFEVISVHIDMEQNLVLKYVEVIWDTINCLQGLFILILVLTSKKVLSWFHSRVSASIIHFKEGSTRQTTLHLVNIN